MSAEYLTSLFTYIFVTNISPGPNKMLLVTSGIHFGLKRTFPQILGVATGISVTIFLVGLGIAKVFEQYPGIYTAIKWLGLAYMLYLAYGIATASAVLEGPKTPSQGSQGSQGSQSGRGFEPLGYVPATTMQWLNPKAWTVGVVSAAAYVPQVNQQTSYPHLFLVAGGFFALSILTSSLWTGFGVQLRHWLSDPKRLRAFNWVMALALVASVVPLMLN